MFGDWVELADSGLTLAVGYCDQGIYTVSSVAIYKSVNGAWQEVRTIIDRTDNGEICKYGPNGHAFSRDGSTLAQICGLPDTRTSTSMAISFASTPEAIGRHALTFT